MDELLFITLKRFENEYKLQRHSVVDYSVPKYEEMCFKNYKCRLYRCENPNAEIYLSKDLKYAYCYYDLEIYKYKVINVQRKPNKKYDIKDAILKYQSLIAEENRIKIRKRNIIDKLKEE